MWSDDRIWAESLSVARETGVLRALCFSHHDLL